MSTILSRRDLLRRTSRFALATPLLSLTACNLGSDRGRTMTFAGPTMGTSYSVTVAEPPAGLDRRALKVEIDGHLATTNRQMSNWRSDSEISRFNAEVPGAEFLALVVTCTVFMSLVAHGMSANPLAKWIGRKEQKDA